MQLYKIARSIQKCFKIPTGEYVDTDTGEVFDEEYLNGLRIAKTRKIENIACWIKNLQAEADAYKKEEEAFRVRRKQAESRIESLKRYLTNWVPGEKIETDRCKVAWRKSVSVEIQDESQVPEAYKKEKVVMSVDKVAIKKALTGGETITGASLLEKQNIQIS